MHPDIIKFWQDAGYQFDSAAEVYKNNKGKDIWRTFIFLELNGKATERVCVMESCYSDKDKKNVIRSVKYDFNNQEWSEKEMLKIIKLRAFI